MKKQGFYEKTGFLKSRVFMKKPGFYEKTGFFVKRRNQCGYRDMFEL